MHIKKVFLTIPIVFAVFFAVYYLLPEFLPQAETIYISITIFLFATLSGFFISRQAARYVEIVRLVAIFDGQMTFLYRAGIAMGEDFQAEIEKIVRKHYSVLFKANSWDSYFNKKTNTITSITNLVVEEGNNKKEKNDLQKAFLGRAGLGGILELQTIRKQLITMYQERIPSFQWTLIVFLATLLIATVSSISSVALVFPSAVKAAFATSIIAVLIMLYKLNHLTFMKTC